MIFLNVETLPDVLNLTSIHRPSKRKLYKRTRKENTCTYRNKHAHFIVLYVNLSSETIISIFMEGVINNLLPLFDGLIMLTCKN